MKVKEQVAQAARDFALPETLLLAWGHAETNWNLLAERYEPNLDCERVSGCRSTWASHPEWLLEGPTCEEFFVFHPDRESDWRIGRDYNFVAQTELASTYGPFQLAYPSALRWGYTGLPTDLRESGIGIHWAARVLCGEIELAEAMGMRGLHAQAFGLMSVGGVLARERIVAVDAVHERYYGHKYFGGE